MVYIPSTGKTWTKDEIVAMVKGQCNTIGIPYELLYEPESEDKYYEISSGT